MEIPFSKETVNEVLQKMHIPHVGNATIRQTVALSEELEKMKFDGTKTRMLTPNQVCTIVRFLGEP